MASSSRDALVSQQISGLTVTEGSKLFAGTANNTTNNVYNGPLNLQIYRNKAEQPKEQTPSYYEVPNHRVGGFVGREVILQKIDVALSDGAGPHYAILQGIGGQGKSQVALEYCHRKKDNPYSAIFWVDATTEDTVKGSFWSISERLKVRTDHLPDIKARVAFVLRMLTSWTFRWLMVFDNYDNPDAFQNIQEFIPQSELGAMLVTSRHPDSNALVINQSHHFIELFGLEENAAVALLVQQSQAKESISVDAKNIVERLGCHPLAVTQAAAYIRKRKLRPCEFLDHYKRRRKVILENTPQLSHYRKKLGNAEVKISLNVFTTLELSFQQFQSQASENNVEVKLLTLLAYFDEKDISEQLFAEFNANQEKTSESSKLLLWLEAFRNAVGEWESDLFADVLIRLRDSSLLQAFTRERDGFYHSSLHPLVKDWIQLRTDKSICQDNIYMAATLVKDVLVNSWQEQEFDFALLAKQNISFHIIALEGSYEELSISQERKPSNHKLFDEYMNVQTWFARFLLKAGLFHHAAMINRRRNAHNENVFGLEHPATLSSMGDLASTYLGQGRWKEAEKLGIQLMETSSRVLGLEHPDTLTSINNLASIFSNQGRWKEAEELGMQVMEARKRVLGREHPRTLTSMSNLELTFSNQGRWKEAEELGMQVMETSSRVLGVEHPNTLTSMSNLALTFANQDRWKEAVELQIHVMETSKRVLELEHPDTLASMSNLALTFLNQDRWQEAEELGMEVIEASSRVLGLEHPNTLSSMSNLAFAFSNQGRWKEAEELGMQVMETRKKMLGLEHPNTLTSINNLALTFSNQGRWKEAEELGIQVMETSSRVLGPKHPNTLSSMSNLAFTFWSLGRRNKAIELMSEVVQYSREKIGSDHPDTLESMRALQTWLDEN